MKQSTNQSYGQKFYNCIPPAGVMSFHGSQLAQKAGDRNFTQGNNLTVAIQNGYLDPSNNASQLAAIQAELQNAQVPFYLTNYGEPWQPAP